MSKSQIAAMIARRTAAKKRDAGRADPILSACIDASGFSEHRAY